MAKTKVTPRKAPKEIKRLSDLRTQRRNINKGKPAAISEIGASIRRDRFSAPMVAAADGEVFIGSKRLQQAAEVFGADSKPIVIKSDGTRPIVHIRTDIPSADDEKAQRLGYVDNVIPVMDWNPDADLLAQLAAEDEIVAALAKQENESLKALRESDGSGNADAEPQIDKAEELNERWKVERGDLWIVGAHRLLCGDSTVQEYVERVMDGELADFCFTDPPYGVKYTGGTKKWTMLENDDEVNMYAGSLPSISKFTTDKAALYCAFADANARSVYNSFFECGYTQRALIIWNKNQDQFGAMGSQYKQKHEPIAYCFKSGKSPHWFGPNNEVTVWDIDRESVNEFHPTQKPVELYLRAMANSAPPNCVVFEPFSGSGTSLVASENTGRKCRAIELSPAYVAVALQRMSDAFPYLDIHRA